MTISVRSVATAVPPTVIQQPDMRDLLLAQPERSRLARRLISAAFDASAIDTRHTVVRDLDLAHGSDPAAPPPAQAPATTAPAPAPAPAPADGNHPDVRLLLLRTTDKPGMESDDFELRIDDRDSAAHQPSSRRSMTSPPQSSVSI